MFGCRGSEILQALRPSLPRAARQLMRSAAAATRNLAMVCLLEALLVAGVHADDADPFFAGFGDGGKRVISGHTLTGMVVQPDGKIVLSLEGDNFEVMRLQADGEPDPSFSGDGLATLTNPSFAVHAADVAIQADGKILLAGTADAEPRHFVVARITPDGELDPTFDGDGWVTTDFDNDEDYAHVVLVQPDGKIVVAGSARVAGDYDFAVARYLSTGELDSGFGGDGKVTVGFGDEDYSRDIALQEDGKLVLVGGSSEDFDDDFALARLHPNGSLDTSFSSDGKVLSGFGDYEVAHGVDIQPDGRIIVVGFYNNLSGIPGHVVRYLPNGALDPTFDGDGHLSSAIYASDVAVQPDGKIVLLGAEDSPSGDWDWAFHRLLPNGALDNSFDGNGVVLFDFDSNADDTGSQLQLLPDGRMLGVGPAPFYVDKIALVQLWPDGSMDAGGQQALALDTPTFPPGSDEYAYGMAVQPDGRILVAGTVVATSGTESDCVLTRFLPNGLLDGTFGQSGRVAVGVHNLDAARALVLQPDGKIVLAGYMGSPNTQFLIARFNSDGSLDTSFGLGGTNVLDFFGSADYGHAVGLAPDGKIYVAGDVTNAGNIVFGIARFNTNGNIDTSFDGDGKQIYAFSGMPGLAAHALLVQSDGKVIVGGQANGNFALVRFLTTGALDAAFGTGGATMNDMGGVDAIHALAFDPSSGRIFAAGGGGAGRDFALARYSSSGVLATCPTHGCTDWPLGKAYVDWGGDETAWAIEVRTGRVFAAGCVNGLMGYAQLSTTSSTNPIKRTTDFPGGIECEMGGESFTQGGAGIHLAFSNKVFVTATQNMDGDRNIALAAFRTSQAIVSDAGEDEQSDTTLSARLQAAFPNPLVNQSVIAFDLARSGAARLRIYDVAGRLVNTLADGTFTAGRHPLLWNGSDHTGRRVAAGVYFARLEAGEVHAQQAIIVMR